MEGSKFFESNMLLVTSQNIQTLQNDKKRKYSEAFNDDIYDSVSYCINLKQRK